MRGGRPIKVWARDIEEGALEQAENLSKLPFAIRHVALMPDAHQGYGMPIGGVLFADKAVVPYAIGVDIGCGVSLIDTGLTAERIEGDLASILTDIKSVVPTGFQTLPQKADPLLAVEAMQEGVAVDLNDLLDESPVLDRMFDKALWQLGTLGGGNHFLELQTDESDRVFVMLHSGSRSLGKAICDEAHKVALGLNERWHSVLPHRELAYLPVGTAEFDTYWSRMNFALRFAEVNRARMMARVIEVLGERYPGEFTVTALGDIHHNYAAWENHFGKNGIVHRKGAVRARAGETVFIPGSMGTASYVAEGLGNPETFNTCQHGAGRAKTRTAMRKSMTTAQVFEEMAALGVGLVSAEPETVMEEAPSAYKDIEDVMALSADIVRPLMRLTPLGVVKG